jgi:putative acetyltransferase
VARLKTLDARHGELKSMRTNARSCARAWVRPCLDHISGAQARARGLLRLSLETGTAPVRAGPALYRRNGFLPCGPLPTTARPHSLFMSRHL